MSWRRLPSTNDYTTTLTLHLGWPLTKARWGWSCFPRLVVLVYLFRIVYLHLMFSYAWHLFPCKTGNLLQSPFFLRVAEIGQITGSFLAWLPARWYWNPDQSHLKWLWSGFQWANFERTCQHTCHNSRVDCCKYIVCIGFRSWSRRCLLIISYPKSCVRVDAFLSMACFPKQDDQDHDFSWDVPLKLQDKILGQELR